MKQSREVWERGLTVGACLLVAGCNTSGGGGGGGGGGAPDPLAQYRLDQDENFDAVIAEITAADNRILGCLNEPGDPESFTDQETLDALKGGFQSFEEPDFTFDEFIVTIQTNEPVKADEICDTQLGDDPTFAATIARLTTELNRAANCTGDESVDDAESLQDLKRTYFRTVEAIPPITDFANELADTAEAQADAACGN